MKISWLLSVTFLAGHGEICTPHGQHADPHGRGAFLRKTTQEIHVDRSVVGWSAGRHVDRPCGVQISPWTARQVTDSCREILARNLAEFCGILFGS